MKLIKERSITVVFDAVSISKDIEILGGSLTQNFYSESRTYIPNRFITPISLTPKVYIVDPNNIIPSGDKHEELLECIWYEDGNKIITNDEYKLNKDNTLTVLKNSEKDFTISYSAKWLDPRKKQIITVEDSVQFVTIALGDGNIKPRLTLDKAQNWIHNPLKNERVYSIKAYVSKDKLYEGAVEWYCTLKGAEKKLIDTSFLFYEGGQYSNELKVNSAYMPDCIITAKNISDNKLKEIYWFFDKHGNPLTYAMPDKTIIEGSNDFSLPESPITSKLDYKIEGLTLTNLVQNGDFSDGMNGWMSNLSTSEVVDNVIINTPNSLINASAVGIYQKTDYNKGDVIYLKASVKCTKDTRILLGANANNKGIDLKSSSNFKNISANIYIEDVTIKTYKIYYSTSSSWDSSDRFYCKNFIAINITQTFGAGNEPTKEWCDEHITGYFEGTKSVQAPIRIKSVGENLWNNNISNSKYKYVGGHNNYVQLSNNFYYKTYSGTGQVNSKFVGNDIIFEHIGYGPQRCKITNLKPDTIYYISYIPDWDQDRAGYRMFGNISMFESFKNKRVFVEVKSNYLGEIETIFAADSEDNRTTNLIYKDVVLSEKKIDFIPYTESIAYISNQIELKSVVEVKDYIENGKLYKYISDDGEILEQPEIVNLSTQGNLTTYPNGTIFIEPATLVEKQYNDGLQVDLPVKTLESIKVRAEYLDVSKAVVNDNLITHPKLENGDFVTVEYIYDDNPIYGTNSIGYLSLEKILDEYWLENVYTYKVTNGEWELVKITDIENYEEWLKTEKTSPYTLAPDGVIFGKYEADTKFIRQFPSSLYVDFIAPDRLKEGVTQIKARALVGTKDGVIDRPSRYFKITWLKRALRPGQQDIVIGTGDEIIVDVGEKDAITIEIEDLGILKALVNEQGEYLTEENNKILVGR